MINQLINSLDSLFICVFISNLSDLISISRSKPAGSCFSSDDASQRLKPLPFPHTLVINILCLVTR